jgi:DNA-binding NtrC family response regulator
LEDGLQGARLVASTSADLEKTAGRGAFLPALLERLGTPVPIPALRLRREDIVPLARVLGQSRAADAGLCGVCGWDADFTEPLLLYPFPRNLRELGDVMLTASLNAREARTLTHRHLPDAIRAACREARKEPCREAPATD